MAIALAASAASAAADAPRRIVSLDYCADQYVLALADRTQIAAVSRGAVRDDSFYRERARGLPRVRGGVEETLAQRPDLVVRSWGGGFDAPQRYARFGIPVLQVGDAQTFAAARADLLNAARAMGQSARGEALATDLDSRLAALARSRPAHAPDVLYMTVGGAVAGGGVMMDEVIRTAGGRNARSAAGWQVMQLERLVATPPQIVALGFFENAQGQATPWNYARNAALARALAPARRVVLPADQISCEAWYTVGAAEALAAAVRAL